MKTLLIADRDKNERTGIRWLVHSYGIPFGQILFAGSAEELFSVVEKEMPHLVCVELEMIGKHQWDEFRRLMKRNRCTVIGMTAEATFERVMQAIECKVLDLWVKPLSPDRIRQTLNGWYRSNQEKDTNGREEEAANKDGVSYHDLFLPGDQQKYASERLMLIQPQHPRWVPRLYGFLQEHPFFSQTSLLPLSDMVVSVCKPAGENAGEVLHSQATHLLKEWNEQSREPLLVLIDFTEKEPRSLHEKYRHARQALEIHFFKGYNQVIVVNEPLQWRSIDPFLSPQEQRLWVDMLQQLEKERVKAWLYQDFLQLTPPYPDPGMLRIRLTSILAQVRRFMISHDLLQPHYEEKYRQMFETILYEPILYRIVQNFILFISDLLESAAVHQQQGMIDVVEQGIQYIEKHFANPNLHLEEVSRHVGRSPAYFSHLLSTKYGMSFREILTQVRIKEAKKLLLQTGLTVQEIAYQTGFHHANYFTKIFRIKTGMSPRAFRNQKNV